MQAFRLLLFRREFLDLPLGLGFEVGSLLLGLLHQLIPALLGGNPGQSPLRSRGFDEFRALFLRGGDEFLAGALRLGAEKVYIVYRRSLEELPARREEVEHAMEEGIEFKLLNNPVEILGYNNPDDKRDPKNGFVTGMKCIRMELGEPDESGRRRPVEVPGSEFVMELDTVIMSLGTSPNPLISSTTKGLDTNKWKCIIADENNGKTTKEGVYAGGDAVTGAATVILAMGAGKAAAKGIDEYLSTK